MPDEVQEQATEQAPEEKAPEVTLEQLTEQLQQALKIAETQKNEIAGLNRKVSEEQKAVNELKTKNMTDEERRQQETLEMQKTLTNQFKENALLKAEIPLELAGLVKGSNQAEINQEVDMLAKYRIDIQSSIAKENEALKKQLEEYRVKGQATKAPIIGSASIDRSKLTIQEATDLYKRENGLT